MLNLFKRKDRSKKEKIEFDTELTAAVLAYEIARSDGDVSDKELEILFEEIKKISKKVKKSENEILKIIENFSSNSVSFHDFIQDINKEFTKNDKLSLISFLWKIAYADNILEVNEEKLLRRISDLIHIKDIEVLKIKDFYKNNAS